MGAVDLVIQIESPPSVASALQRVGRAGHQVGEVSRGVLYPKHRGDLAQTAVAVERMRTGGIEAMRIPANPLDVLAQQVVAATALEPVDVDELFALVRRSAPFAQLPRSGLRRHARPAQRALPQRRVRRAAPAHRLGPGHRHPHRTPGRPAPGGDQRRHHPRPRPVRGLPRRRRGPRQAGRRARRGDGLRVPGRRRLRPRRHQLAHRGHHPRPGAGHPGTGRARATAVLEGRHPGAPGRARRRHRRLHPRARRPASRDGRRPRARERRPRRVGRRQPRRPTSTSSSRPPTCCPATPRSWSSGSATSSATGAWSSTRPTACPCTRPGRWPSTPGCASATASTARRWPPTTASSSGSPTPTPSRPAAT